MPGIKVINQKKDLSLEIDHYLMHLSSLSQSMKLKQTDFAPIDGKCRERIIDCLKA